MHTPRHLGLGLAAVLLFIDLATAQMPTRRFLAEDMFRVQRVGAVAWSADGRYAAIELTRPGPWLNTVPNTNLSLLDVRQRTLRRLNPTSASYLGFFNAMWSPDGRRLAFLSVDERAVLRLWIWTVGTHNPAAVPDLEPRYGPGDPPLAWIDAQRMAVIAWLPDVARQGQLFARIQRGRNSADRWRRAATRPTTSSASVLESAGSTPAPDTDRLIAMDVVSGTQRFRLARYSSM
jgi:dipeptidyl aminopeptidase/acylaminoacyl peptidase